MSRNKRDLARDTWTRTKQLVLLNGALEDYVLIRSHESSVLGYRSCRWLAPMGRSIK